MTATVEHAWLVCLDCGHYWHDHITAERCQHCGGRCLRDYDDAEDARRHSHAIEETAWRKS